MYNVYGMSMKSTYRHEKNTVVSMLTYYFVFCPRYRRKIFDLDDVEPRFREIVHQICEQNDIEILRLECHADHCHLVVNCPPNMSPSEIMRAIKVTTGAKLRKEFSALSRAQNLWTRSYFVCTINNTSKLENTIQNYIEMQKKRG